jgi:hypothetical protein
MDDDLPDEIDDIHGVTSEELFAPNIPPITILGKSGIGKTTLLIDQARTDAHKVTGIISVCGSAESAQNQALRDAIPIELIRDFDISYLLGSFSKFSSIINYYNKYTNPNEIWTFAKRNCATNQDYLATMERIKALYDNIISLMRKLRKDAVYDKEQKVKEKMLLRGTMEWISNHYSESSENLNTNDKHIAAACRMTPPYQKMQIDDATTEMSNAGISKTKISVQMEYEGNLDMKLVSSKEAQAIFLSNLYTKGRQFGIFVVSLHTIGDLSATARDVMGPLIFSTMDDIQSISRLKTSSPDLISRAQRYMEKIVKYQFCKLIYYPNLECNPYKNSFAFFRARRYNPPMDRIGCKTYRYALESILRFINENKAKSN